MAPNPVDVGKGSTTERVSAFIDGGPFKYTGWANRFFEEGLSLHSTSTSPVTEVVFEYTCHENHANSAGNLHGGCTATLFDFCTSVALVPISKPDFWQFTGVSRTLNVTYIRPIPVGETVLIVCEVVHVGKRMAALKGVMKRKSDGAVMATCEHGKVNVGVPTTSKL